MRKDRQMDDDLSFRELTDAEKRHNNRVLRNGLMMVAVGFVLIVIVFLIDKALSPTLPGFPAP
jgi:hypothetical protein